MSILESNGTTYMKRCDGVLDAAGTPCHYVAVQDIADLTAGHVHDPNVIILPQCTECGGVEYLNRTFALTATEHHAWVNALHAHLVTTGRSHPSHKAALESDPNPPKNIRALDTSDTPGSLKRRTPRP